MTFHVGQMRVLNPDRYGAHLALLTWCRLLPDPTRELAQNRNRIDDRTRFVPRERT
ncbi:hypothetical protein OG809_18575 [Kribbella soli]